MSGTSSWRSVSARKIAPQRGRSASRVSRQKLSYCWAHTFQSGSHFLKRSFNKGTAEITGEKVNHGGGYGLEIPCMYRLYRPKTYIKRAKTVISWVNYNAVANMQPRNHLCTAVTYSINLLLQ